MEYQWGGGRGSTVWLNPPYSTVGVPRGMEYGDRSKSPSVVKMWIDKLINEYRQGNVSQAILLVKADPKQRWFQPLWDFSICFVPGKIIFNRPDARPEGHMFGSCLVYLGPNEDKFIEVFQHLGTVVRRIAPQS